MSRLADLRRFYSLLDEQATLAGGLQTVGQVLSAPLPSRGVYFFFEPGEIRRESGAGQRVVRVGTHGLGLGSKSTLKQRLRQHAGQRAGGGNHRGSIFRLLVGQALLSRDDQYECGSWGIKGEARKAALAHGSEVQVLKDAEAPVEQRVSAHIATMSLLYVPILDEPGPHSVRGLIERNAIALLSNRDRDSLDLPSKGWLGHHSNRHLVRSSGLWNQNHVEEVHAGSFLETLERQIASSS